MKCAVKDCENRAHEGKFVGLLCSPCHTFIAGDGGLYSQAYRNSRNMIDTAIAHEREECAKIAEKTICDVHLPTGTKIYGSRVATAIRARGTT
jgi:hypothetical protein